jgi:hypothetical protein
LIVVRVVVQEKEVDLENDLVGQEASLEIEWEEEVLEMGLVQQGYEQGYEQVEAEVPWMRMKVKVTVCYVQEVGEGKNESDECWG